MRIISNFHDYYDSALGFGRDPNIIYERHERRVEAYPYQDSSPREIALVENACDAEEQVHSVKLAMSRMHQHFRTPAAGIIFFCGGTYPYVRLGSDHYIQMKDKVPPAYCFFLADADKQAEKLPQKVRDQFMEGEDKRFDMRRGDYVERTIRGAVGNFLNTSFASENRLVELHRQLEAPIFVYEQWEGFRVIVNPMLKNFEFYKAMDPFSAFQEISMFLSGVIGGKERDTVEIGDNLRAEMHGFDKWSFRRPPSGKKKK